ncbi:MAG: aldo/keto reductase [Acidobacteriota bacterium]|nr:aldo/keto reductase [Acidobacteriota bacterium]
MKLRELGRSGIQVPALCFGGNVFGWTVDETRSFALLDALVDAGLNFVDTADIYSTWVPGHQGGESETILGRWFAARKNRAKVVLATKVGMPMGEGGKGKTSLSKKYILQEAEASLRRLQTDYIDLYQSHRDDPDTPQEETLEAYAELIKAGKVRAIGCSNFTAERIESSLAISAQHNLPCYETAQPEYNLYDRAGFEEKIEGVCAGHGIGVIPYYSLASGFLSGKYRSEKEIEGRPRAGTLKRYFNERGTRVLSALDEAAKELHATPAQISLAWLMQRPALVAPIASATTVEQLQELVGAVNLELPTSVVEKLEKA